MARGRRLAILDQATAVWAIYEGDLDLGAYIETGSMGHENKTLPPNPLADKIAQEIERTGKLIVDPAKFEQWQKELGNGKPQ